MSQPNILLVMADELTPFLTGAYGHPVVQTPALNALASRGIRFDAAYSPSPVCAPARACLMTGLHMSRNGCYDNAAPFSCDTPTVAHYLARAGYDCVLSGKMHFVGPDQLHGFRTRLTTDIYPEEMSWVERFSPWVYSREHDIRPGTGGRHHAREYTGEHVPVGAWSHYLEYDEETHYRARAYLRAKGVERRQGSSGRAPRPGVQPTPDPFFLCVSYHHPHEPFWPPRDLWDLYDGAEIDVPDVPDDLEASYSAMDRWLNAHSGTDKYDLTRPDRLRRMRRAYYALVTYFDRKLGDLIRTLDESGLAEDTVVVVTSDHGDMLAEKRMVQKRVFYEWSARVPLVMRLPDGRQAATVRPEPVSLIDLLPTMLDLAGVPETDRLTVDGHSLLPLLDGAAGGAVQEREVFSETHAEGVPATCFMIRRGRYKYVYIADEAPQLFDLATDAGEWRNLVAGPPDTVDPAHAAIAADLEARILARFDPPAIERAVRDSIARRRLVNAAMQRTGTTWAFTPPFNPNRDAITQYLNR
jgi:choline-sulfatase